MTWTFSCGAGGARTRDREIMSTRRLSAVPLSAPGVFLVSAAQRVLCCRGSRPAALAVAGPLGQLLVRCEGWGPSVADASEIAVPLRRLPGRRSGRARRSRMRSRTGSTPPSVVSGLGSGWRGAACQGTGRGRGAADRRRGAPRTLAAARGAPVPASEGSPADAGVDGQPGAAPGHLRRAR